MGLDQPLDPDCQVGERAMRHHMGDVAEGVLMDVETGISRDVDLPFRDILAVMAARRHPQDLDHARCWRIVAIGGGVKDFQAHGGRSNLRAGTIPEAISAVMPGLDPGIHVFLALAKTWMAG